MMIGRLSILGLLLAATIGCGENMLGSSGSAGSTGVGTGSGGAITGVAGAMGGAGTGGAVGGTGGSLPACGGSGGAPDRVSVAIVGSDGELISANMSATVTVTAIDSCATVTCPTSFSFVTSPNISPSAKRIAFGDRTLYLEISNLPADFIKVGDTFDLTVDARVEKTSFGTTSQTVILAHGAELVLFAAASSGYGGAVLPDLRAFQIGVTRGGDVCQTTTTSGQPVCGYVFGSLNVTVGGDGATLTSGQSGRIGWLSFTNGGISRAVGGFCDAPSGWEMGGFRVSPTGSGGGGAGGSGGGSGGSGGTGGTLVACASGDGASDVADVQLVGSDDALVAAPVTASVNVASVESCAAATCPSGFAGAGQKVFLTAVGPRSWTLYLRNSAMPADYIKTGDTFDMTVEATAQQTLYRTVDQTVVLARSGNVILFAASLQGFFRLSVPPLQPFGIAVIDEGAYCQSITAAGCIPRLHAARVSMGSDASIVLMPGQTKTIGGLSVTNGEFTEYTGTGTCDRKSPTKMAAFRLPSTN